jgi:hypothetical protein
MINMNYEVARLELGEIAEETGGANLSAGTLNGGGYLEQVGIPKERDLGLGKGYAIGERRAHEQEASGFLGGFGGESGGGVFRLAEDVGHFVLAADIGEAFELAGACGSENDSAARSYLRFDFAHAGDDVAVKAWAGPGGQLELGMRTDVERQMLKVDLRCFLEGGSEFFLVPEVMVGGGRVGLAVALVVFCGRGKVLGGGFTNCGWLIEKDNRAEGAFRQFDKGAGTRLRSRAEE